MSKAISRDELLFFLRKNNLAVLATTSEQHHSHAAAVFVFVTDDFLFFFMTKKETRKYLNISQNDHVALVFTEGESMKTVQMTGIVHTNVSQKKQEEIIALMTEEFHHRYSFAGLPVSQMEGTEILVARIDPEWIRYADFDGITGEPECFQNIGM